MIQNNNLRDETIKSLEGLIDMVKCSHMVLSSQCEMNLEERVNEIETNKRGFNVYEHTGVSHLHLHLTLKGAPKP